MKLPGGSQPVIISSHSALEDGRYYDVESSSSFAYDHITQVSLSTEQPMADGSTWNKSITPSDYRKPAMCRATS